MAERGGNFSALTTPIYKPSEWAAVRFQWPTQCHGSNANHDAGAGSFAVHSPAEFAGTTQNFHEVTSSERRLQLCELALDPHFWSRAARASRGGRRRTRRRGGGRRRSQNNLNMGLSWTKTTADIVGAFPSLNGGTGTQGLNANAGMGLRKGRATNNLRFTYNHNHVSTTNCIPMSPMLRPWRRSAASRRIHLIGEFRESTSPPSQA